jgi:putative membrane-bound dehydrogenase-like protein
MRRIVLMLLLLNSSESIQAQTLIPVGVAATDITPDYRTRLSGYYARKTESTGVALKIWAKAMAFGTDKGGASVLIAIDNLGVPDAMVARLAERLQRRAGLAREGLVVAASHTHSAPILAGVAPHIFGRAFNAEEQATIDRYTREVEDRLEAVALAALADRRPAAVAWGKGTVGFASNRRTQGGPVDHSLPFLSVAAPDGKTRALLVNYACHCTTIDPIDNTIHPDWAGEAQRHLESAHPDAIALTVIGCGADANPVSMHGTRSNALAAEHGRALALEVDRVLRDGPLRPISAAPTRTSTRISLPYDTLPTREQLSSLVQKGGPPGFNAQVFLDRLGRGQPLPQNIETSLTAWRFGNDLAMVFLPGEVVVDYVLRLKHEFDPERLWVTAYANDDPCYIPSERILREGGYEGGGAMVYYGHPTRLAPGVEDRIIRAVQGLIPTGFEPSTHDQLPPVHTPEQARRAIRVKPGMKVELVAAEPWIESPVAIDWGGDGTLWVSEMRDYPSGVDGKYTPGGVIKALRDVDNDGRFDRADVFLTGLPFPTGVMAYGKGVLVCAAPEIIYAEDTDGDGKADVRRVVFRGFATENYQARVNGLSFALDNWIYGANGLIGGRIEGTTGGPAVDIGGRDFRLSADLTRLEPATGLTQQGRVHNDWGEQFGGSNSVLITHYPFPDHYARRNPYVAVPSPSVYLPSYTDSSRIYPASAPQERFNEPQSLNRVSSACSPCIYRDDLLGTGFHGNVFICEPVHNLVHREVLTRRGVTFSGVRAGGEQTSEFLASTDPWFRPVQVRTGPDGALYVVDMARYVIEHPHWISPERLASLDVRAGHDRGRIYRIVSEAGAARAWSRLDRLSTAELAKALDSPNGTLRDLVHRLLVERSDRSALPELEELAGFASRPEVRAQALGALDGLYALSSSILLKRLSDADPNVRCHAVRLSESRLNAEPPLALACLRLTADPDIVVRYQLALSLGAWDDPRARRGLAELAISGSGDPWLLAAILSSAYRGASEVLAALVGEERCRSMIGPLVRVVAHEPPAAVTSAVASLVETRGRRPEPWRIAALTDLFESLDADRLAQASFAADHFAAIDAEARLLLSRDDADPADRAIGVRWLARPGGDKAGREVVLAAITPATPSTVQAAAVSALARSNQSGLAEALIARWSGLVPALRPVVLDALADRADSALALLAAVEAGTIRPAEIDAAHRQRMLAHADPRVRDLAGKKLGVDAGAGRATVLARYRQVQPDATLPARGESVFVRICAACHLYRGKGNAVGPDLAALTDRSPESFLTAIFDPNRDIDARHVVYAALLKDGRTLTGMIASETANAITLTREAGKSDSILRAELEAISSTSRSLMPEGFENELNPADYSRLLAYLNVESRRPKSLAGNRPRRVEPGPDGSIRLDASLAEVYGPTLTFEPEFSNLGYWQSPDDRAAWTFRVEKPGTYTLSIDMACAEGSSGNTYEIRLDSTRHRRVVGATGPDWSLYRGVFVAEVRFEPGEHRMEVRSAGPVCQALFDLRAVVLTGPRSLN